MRSMKTRSPSTSSKVDVDGARGGVAGDLRDDLDEGEAGLSGLEGHALDHAVDLAHVVDFAGPDLAEQRREGFRVQTRRGRADGDLADIVARTLVDREGEEKPVAFTGDLGGGGEHPEIDIAALEIELPQQLAVELEAVGVIGHAAENETQPVRLIGFHDAAQAAVVVDLVSDEIDALDRRHAALEHLEDQVDAVVGLADDHRRHLGGVAAGLAIGLDDALRVGLGGGDGIGDAGPQFDHRAEILVTQRVVALEGDAVDRGVFLDGDDEPAGLGHDFDVFEEAGLEEPSDREVEFLGRDRDARIDPGEDADGLRLDPLVAGDVDPAEHGRALRMGERRRHECQKKSHDYRNAGPAPHPVPLSHRVSPLCPRGVCRPSFNSPVE